MYRNKTRTVFKYPFPIEDRFEISLPNGARILHVESQHGRRRAFCVCA